METDDLKLRWAAPERGIRRASGMDGGLTSMTTRGRRMISQVEEEKEETG